MEALVAPLVGAWIEIITILKKSIKNKSLPSWERGLKFSNTKKIIEDAKVAPLVGAWIEILCQ